MKRILAIWLALYSTWAAASGGAAEPATRLPIVFPAPVRIEHPDGALPVDGAARVVAPAKDRRLTGVAELLSRELGGALAASGSRLAVVAEERLGAAPGRGDVLVGTLGAGRLAARRLGALAGKLPARPGAYVLSVGREGCAILGHDAQGAFYGVLTLLQLLRPGGVRGEIAFARVVDFPRRFYRGMRATLPRGKPRKGEITHAYYRDLLRAMAFCRLNHVWVQGTSWNTPMRRHPEVGWTDVLTPGQTKGLVDFAGRHFLSMDGSLDWQWVYYKYKHLAELYPDETWQAMRKVRKRSRVNVCPSNPETWKMLLETMDDVMESLPGDHFAVPLDEMYQEYHGSRWAVCPRCRDKDPVKLFAEFASRLTARVIERGRVPIVGGGMLLREHQGWYKGIYKAVDLIENRGRIVVYNWSEGHIRRGAMRVEGKRLQRPGFKATPFFRGHGYKDVLHLFAGNDRWAGRPEMREVRGKLDCYGGVVAYYHSMDYEAMQAKGTIGNLAFTAQHLWSPDRPPMDSAADLRACRYAECLVGDILQRGSGYVAAIAAARKASRRLADNGPASRPAGGRPFESADPPVELLGPKRGTRTEGRMRIVLPVEEARPGRAQLVLTMFDWDQHGEGEIYLNGHRIALPTSSKSNWRDHEFPPVRVPAEWLRFGPEPNVLRFVWRSTSGFIAKKARIVLSDRPPS